MKCFSFIKDIDSNLSLLFHIPKHLPANTPNLCKSLQASTVEYELAGQKFIAINGGASFKLSEAVSFVIDCDSQEKIDYYWNKLAEDGNEENQVCGWLKDKFGLSWQIMPDIILKIFSGSDTEKIDRAMGAVLKMKKINAAEIEKAASGE